ncbi:hypothetical protein PDE_05124 [Penicillium oxalicum 114-2]|uniref:Uncharacterized protein n=1 Tax=Penicillium oxalicum (strain 114-2 / CGMCC 5302) TaxID=933388 RepID=S7ZIR1_PENO1|nr:hypothetical protein PDE_05124 [Penicillium oxalicum 114-2]
MALLSCAGSIEYGPSEPSLSWVCEIQEDPATRGDWWDAPRTELDSALVEACRELGLHLCQLLTQACYLPP